MHLIQINIKKVLISNKFLIKKISFQIKILKKLILSTALNAKINFNKAN